jgi:TetR/AcrR family transcriptional regulator
MVKIQRRARLRPKSTRPTPKAARPAPKAKRAIRASNQARILLAAEEIFASRGFAGATTAAVAARAGLPKANVHYYFRTKQALYRAVLTDILAAWLAELDVLQPEADPAAALRQYIRAKIAYSRARPFASKVFANELLHGALEIGAFLGGAMKAEVDAKAAVIRQWAAEGRILPIDPYHLLFVIWAATQTYADFDCQVAAVLGKRALQPADFERAAETTVALVLRGLGLPAP